MKALTLAAVGLAGWPLAEAEGKPDTGGLQWQGQLVGHTAHQSEQRCTGRGHLAQQSSCQGGLQVGLHHMPPQWRVPQQGASVLKLAMACLGISML